MGVLLLLTLVALPLGLIGLLSLALLYALGLVVASLVLGRRLVREPRGAVLTFTAGWAILRLVDLIPVLGDLITATATVFGLAPSPWPDGGRPGARRAPPRPAPHPPRRPPAPEPHARSDRAGRRPHPVQPILGVLLLVIVVIGPLKDALFGRLRRPPPLTHVGTACGGGGVSAACGGKNLCPLVRSLRSLT